MVVHILADGQKVKTIENRVVPLNDKTRRAYEVLKERGTQT